MRSFHCDRCGQQVYFENAQCGGCGALLGFVPDMPYAQRLLALQHHGIIVRPVKSYGLPGWIRVTVGTAEQNERLLRELAAVV